MSARALPVGWQDARPTLDDVIFIGDAEVVVPGEHAGIGELVGVPFRVQFPEGDKLSDHVSDVAE